MLERRASWRSSGHVSSHLKDRLSLGARSNGSFWLPMRMQLLVPLESLILHPKREITLQIAYSKLGLPLGVFL
jgi:hypothetical protein